MLLRFLDHKHAHTHTHTHTQSKTPLKEWSDRRRSRYVHNTQQTQQRTPMAPAGYESAIPAIKWLQNYALDRTATGIGISCKHVLEMLPVRSRLQTICLYTHKPAVCLLVSLSLILSFRYFHSLIPRVLLASCLTLFRIPCLGLRNRCTKVGHIWSNNLNQLRVGKICDVITT